MPRIGRGIGVEPADAREQSERTGAAVASGGAVVGADAQTQATHINAKEAAIEDTRLHEMQATAQVYAADWRQQAGQLQDSLVQSWGWDNSQAEADVKAICQQFVDDASATSSAILDSLKTAKTVEDAQTSDDALKQLLKEVDQFREAVGQANSDTERNDATAKDLREVFERAEVELGQLRNDVGAGEVAQVDRSAALAAIHDEAAKLGVEILTDADADIKAYMDDAARREGVSPGDMQAITLGDTIVIREAEAENVRILREELIHVEQQRSGGFGVGAGEDPRTEMELDARRQMVDRAKEWGLTDAEVDEIKEEIEKIEERGDY